MNGQAVETAGRALFALRYPAKPSPAKPSAIIAQVEGSGTNVISKSNVPGARLKTGAPLKVVVPASSANIPWLKSGFERAQEMHSPTSALAAGTEVVTVPAVEPVKVSVNWSPEVSTSVTVSLPGFESVIVQGTSGAVVVGLPSGGLVPAHRPRALVYVTNSMS